MFSLKKDKENKEKQELEKEPVEVSSKISEDIWAKIHVMPQRFYIAPKKDKLKLIILLFLIIFLVVGIIAVAIVLNLYLKKEQPSLTNQPVNLNVSFSNANININQNFNENINQNVNFNTNTNTNLNTNLAIPSPLPTEIDSDKDGLTAIEETLFGTDPSVADTDRDGYLDGLELINGYNPNQAGGKLEDSDLIETYQDTEEGYLVWYPHNWSLNILTSPEKQILFTSLTGESFIILVKDNPDNLNLSEWYQMQFPQIPLELTKVVRLNNLIGLVHPDQLSYYLINPKDLNRIFVLHYNSGTRTKLNFATTFSLFVNSFKLK